MRIAFASLVLVLFGAGCTFASSTPIGTTAPHLSKYCPLEFLTAPPAPNLQLVGYVNVVHVAGTPPDDPSMLAAVKPEACWLGGDKVSVAVPVTDPLRVRAVTGYMVWRTSLGAPAAPKKF